jgi:hypothetical protein
MTKRLLCYAAVMATRKHRIAPAPPSRARSGALSATLLCVCLLGVRSASGESDPGFVMELDQEHYRVSVRDERTGEVGPLLSVVLGSPANPTPAGSYRVSWVILRPSWHPGAGALEAGARPEPSSLTTPMGVLKIPFARGGAIALHGGGDRRLLGRPISGGCVRAGDADLLRMVAWLDLRGALGAPELHEDGEVHRPFRRPMRMIVR